MHMGRDQTFQAGDEVSLANGTEGRVLREVRDNGFRSFLVEVTKSVAPSQVGGTVGATPMYMQHRAAIHLGGRKLRCMIAMTPEEHAQGLQGAPPLLDDEGMLFVFPDERRRSFHMGSVSFPIDIVWFSKDGAVTQSVEHAQPGDRTAWAAPAAYVLELPAGGWAKLGVSFDELRTVTDDGPAHVPFGPHTSPDPDVGGDVRMPELQWANPEQDDQPYEQGSLGFQPPSHSPPQDRFRDHEYGDELYGEAMDPAHWQSIMGRDPMRDEELASGGNRISAGQATRVWFENVSKKDARLLTSWWNANHKDQFFVRAHPTLPGRYQVIRQLPDEPRVAWPKRPKIVDPALFAGALVDAIREGAGLVWKQDALNGEASESAHIDIATIRRWFQRLGVSDFSTAMDAATSVEGLGLIGDTFVLAGMAELARMDANRQGLTLFRRNETGQG